MLLYDKINTRKSLVIMHQKQNYVFKFIYPAVASFPHKFRFAKNKPLLFAILSKMHRKSVKNQIHHGRLAVHLLKVQSSTVEMF